jgi:hypothetical protein
MAELALVRAQAEGLMATHLGQGWAFGFDDAKRRAGLCNYTDRRITVSRYLAARWTLEDIEQVLLHEIAHAVAGHRAGHGPRWLKVARRLGYTGARVHDGGTAHELAPWVGVCPGGHTHYRYRAPGPPLSCRLCGRGFDPSRVINWSRREVTAAQRRAALRATAG